MGAAGALSGVQLRQISGDRGILKAEHVRNAIRPKDGHQLPTSLICIENTHNKAGGQFIQLRRLKEFQG